MTFPAEIWLLRAFMGVILLVGGIISYYALLAWKRQGVRPMLYLGIGFAFVSMAAALAGLIFEVLTQDKDLLSAWIVDSALVMVGLFIILYSLLTQGPRATEDQEASPPAP